MRIPDIDKKYVIVAIVTFLVVSIIYFYEMVYQVQEEGVYLAAQPLIGENETANAASAAVSTRMRSFNGKKGAISNIQQILAIVFGSVGSIFFVTIFAVMYKSFRKRMQGRPSTKFSIAKLKVSLEKYREAKKNVVEKQIEMADFSREAKLRRKDGTPLTKEEVKAVFHKKNQEVPGALVDISLADDNFQEEFYKSAREAKELLEKFGSRKRKSPEKSPEKFVFVDDMIEDLFSPESIAEIAQTREAHFVSAGTPIGIQALVDNLTPENSPIPDASPGEKQELEEILEKHQQNTSAVLQSVEENVAKIVQQPHMKEWFEGSAVQTPEGFELYEKLASDLELMTKKHNECFAGGTRETTAGYILSYSESRVNFAKNMEVRSKLQMKDAINRAQTLLPSEGAIAETRGALTSYEKETRPFIEYLKTGSVDHLDEATRNSIQGKGNEKARYEWFRKNIERIERNTSIRTDADGQKTTNEEIVEINGEKRSNGLLAKVLELNMGKSASSITLKDFTIDNFTDFESSFEMREEISRKAAAEGSGRQSIMLSEITEGIVIDHISHNFLEFGYNRYKIRNNITDIKSDTRMMDYESYKENRGRRMEMYRTELLSGSLIERTSAEIAKRPARVVV